MKVEYEIIHVEAFNSEKKRSGVLIRTKSEQVGHIHWKGAAEMVLSKCSKYSAPAGSVHDIDDQARALFGTIIQDMAAKSLSCIACARRDAAQDDCMQAQESLEENDSTLLAIEGLKDPCRPGEIHATVQEWILRW